MRFRGAAVGVSLLLLAGCGRGQPDDLSRLVVAEIGEEKLFRGELEAYLEQNLAGAGLDSAGEPAELDRVKSRLLDNLVDEKILLAEAERRGVEVSDSELDAWLEGGGGEGLPGTAAADPDSREAARRELKIQKLREAYARAHARVSDEEVDSYLAAHREELEPAPRPYLRRALFRTLEEAKRAFEALEAEPARIERLAGSSGRPEAAVPAELALAQAPPSARAVLRRLEPGEPSEPIEVEGGYAIYLLETRPDPERSSPQALREIAREALLAERYQAAAEELLRELRARTRVILREENLPFRYVPESSSADAAARAEAAPPPR
jgi:hypothetical protein